MTGLEIAAVIAVTAVGALVQGCVGIGIGLIAAPVLVAIDPAFVPGPMLAVGQIVAVRHISAERRHIDLGALRNCLFGLPAGLALGLLVLLVVDERVLSIIIGAVVAVAAAWLLTGPLVRRSTLNEIATGGLVAFASTTAALPGPPLVVAFSDMKPSAMRGTASAVILAVAVFVGVGLVAAGRFGLYELGLSALLAPGALLGMIAARHLRPRLDRSWFRTAVLVVAGAGGIALVARQLI